MKVEVGWVDFYPTIHISFNLMVDLIGTIPVVYYTLSFIYVK